VYNPQAPRSDEIFVFSSKDVVDSTSVGSSASSSSSAAAASAAVPVPSSSPSPSTQLVAGDFVEFTNIQLNADQKKRQALHISRAKDNRPSELRQGGKRKAGAPIIAATRFARGPDKVGIGFAPRKGKQINASPSPSASPEPSTSPSPSASP
jgi:hypothetical protein